ncbi:MAG: hypothetical protein NZ735_07685 [Candidatus Marinimicrobia bacterium]|nr:hypothetical protein [Candidatus Neomarinimicrobiota bacterium]
MALFGDLFIFGDVMEFIFFGPIIVYWIGGIIYYTVTGTTPDW